MTDGPDLRGRTAIVTGASGTLGEAIAALYRACGGNVLLADRGGPAPEAAAERVGPPDRVLPVPVDLAAEGFAEAIVRGAIDRFGGLHALITAAGLLRRGGFADIAEDQVAAMAAVNFDYPMQITRAAIPVLQEGGAILHLASLSAHTGRAGSAQYAAQKAALVALTKSVAAECAPRLRANCLSPGFVRSPLADQVLSTDEDAWRATIPMARFGLPEEVARAAIFLCSDWASYITGQVLHVNGGQYTPG